MSGLVANVRLMRYWLIRSQRTSMHPGDFVACLSWSVFRYGTVWQNGNQHLVAKAPSVIPAVGDRVVLLGAAKRPSFIGIGCVEAIWTHKKKYEQYECMSVKFAELLMDNPVPLEYVRAQAKLGPLRRGNYVAGADEPVQITREQWDVITSVCAQRESPTPQFMRWSIEPGDVVERADLHDRYGGTRGGAVSPSGSDPLVFVFLGARGTRAFTAREDDRRMTIDVKDKDSAAVYGHLREGRALRVFQSVDGAGKKVRYLGQYAVASDNPGSSTLLGQVMRKNRFSSLARPVDVVLHAIDIIPHGATVALERSGMPPLVGRHFMAADDTIVVQGAGPVQTSAKLHTEANRSHRRLQNDLADKVRALGYVPLSPQVDDVPFDLAFFVESKLIVVEIKSVSRDNYVGQFRTGFGQVCEYAEHYLLRGLEVVPVLFMARKPDSAERSSTAARRGVVLGWPDSDDWLTAITG